MPLNLIKTKSTKPPRILIHGPPKVGKSSFFSKAPNPVFVQTEDGLNGIDAISFPICKDYNSIVSSLNQLLVEDHDFKSVILDSADWTEKLIFEKICKDSGENIIARAEGGYGNGYILSLNMWREILDMLDLLNRRKRMLVGIICHSSVIRINNPNHDVPYDVISLKLHTPAKGTGSSNLLQEWVDMIGYCEFKSYIKESGSKKKSDVNPSTARIRSSGNGDERQIFFNGKPQFLAGSRFKIVSPLPLDWNVFEKNLRDLNFKKEAEKNGTS